MDESLFLKSSDVRPHIPGALLFFSFRAAALISSAVNSVPSGAGVAFSAAAVILLSIWSGGS